jgi:hypothetical protein
MGKQEMISRMNEAAKMIDVSGLDLVEMPAEQYSTEDYWNNSISQSYVDAVESGNVTQVVIRG